MKENFRKGLGEIRTGLGEVRGPGEVRSNKERGSSRN